MHPLLLHHRALLSSWRTKMNLVGPGPLDGHYADCQAALSGLQPLGRWADLGSGAGFPGFVFAASFPAVELWLVDSRSKRCAFLERVLATSDVPIEQVRVVRQRVEDLPSAHFDGVTGRAFAPPVALQQHARRLLKPGGQLLLFVQDGSHTPIDDHFTIEAQTPYEVEGKRRRSLLLRYAPR